MLQYGISDKPKWYKLEWFLIFSDIPIISRVTKETRWKISVFDYYGKQQNVVIHRKTALN